jgi:membrane protease YdiL (CAAX protease family)
MNIFFNAGHDLRSGWKFALYVFIFLAMLVVTAIALSMISGMIDLPDSDLTMLAFTVVSLLVPGVTALVFMARFVDHMPLAVYGVAFHERWRKDVLLGLGISAGMLAAMLVGCAAFGNLEITWTGHQTAPSAMLFTLVLLMIAAANEEIVFRGYPMQVLMRGIGPWPAMILMSVLFGVIHANNPNATLLGTINTILAGIMLSLAYFKTRSLWLPYAIHFGWNTGLGMVLGFPLSGIDIGSFWTSRTTSADFIVGGSYGPEGGLVATFIFSAAAVTIRSMRTIQVSSRLREALAASEAKIRIGMNGEMHRSEDIL